MEQLEEDSLEVYVHWRNFDGHNRPNTVNNYDKNEMSFCHEQKNKKRKERISEFPTGFAPMTLDWGDNTLVTIPNHIVSL